MKILPLTQSSCMYAATLLLLITGFTASKNTAALQVSLKEISYGTYHTAGGTVESKDSPTGRHSVITNFSLIHQTDTIDVALGETFGMEYSIVSKTKKMVNIKRVWELPKAMVDGRGNTFKEISREEEENVNVNTITTYELEEDFELLPGNWTLKFYYENKLLYQRTFVLVKR